MILYAFRAYHKSHTCKHKKFDIDSSIVFYFIKGEFIMKKYIPFWAFSACVLISSAAYAANSETVIQTDSHWNKQAIKPIHIEHPQVTILRITIPAGEKLSMHKHPILNIGYLTKGELTVRSEDGGVLVLHPGDPIVELVDIWHYGESTGSEDAEIVVTYVGDKEDPLSIAKE
jgi:quercetin dioxygenase-like cupin family protein